MEYEIFERDFIVRTLKIIRQYEKYVPVSEQFEVTLLINCLLGLLVLPKERCYVDIPDVLIEELEGWGLRADHIKAGPSRSLKEII
ncbi:MAG: HEPN family nuclease [Bacillota bacterium]